MADRYAKKPVANRFQRKSTFAGRDIKRTVVTKRDAKLHDRPKRKLRPLKILRRGR